MAEHEPMFNSDWDLKIPDNFNHGQVTVEGVLHRDPDNMGTRPYVVFSVGTELFMRSYEWFQEYYIPAETVEDVVPENIDLEPDALDTFFDGLGVIRLSK
jgi:hypothetical protein